MTNLLNREALLRKRPRRTRTVPVPELDGTVQIRELSEGERSRFEASLTDKKGVQKKDAVESARRRLIVASVIDESGNAMLTPEDLEAMAEVSASAMNRIFDAARELSGFAEGEIEEEAGKNSGTSQTA